MKKKSALLDPNMVRIIIIILGSVFSTLILAFAVLALINIPKQYEKHKSLLPDILNFHYYLSSNSFAILHLFEIKAFKVFF